MAQRHETEQLLKILGEHGMTPVDAHYSHDNSESIEPNWEEMSNVQDVCLYVRFGEGEDAPQTWLRLVYGNHPGELVSDWGVPRDEAFCAAVETACNTHYNLFNS